MDERHDKIAYDALARSYNELVKKYDETVLQVGELQKALAGMIALAEGASGVTPAVEAEIHKAKSLIKKRKCEKCGKLVMIAPGAVCPECLDF
jgi:hypothetical protein